MEDLMSLMHGPLTAHVLRRIETACFSMAKSHPHPVGPFVIASCCRYLDERRRGEPLQADKAQIEESLILGAMRELATRNASGDEKGVYQSAEELVRVTLITE